jgi:hypothetical protein
MMIPHHQSANEMAQVLLKEPTLIISSSLWVTSKRSLTSSIVVTKTQAVCSCLEIAMQYHFTTTVETPDTRKDVRCLAILEGAPAKIVETLPQNTMQNYYSSNLSSRVVRVALASSFAHVGMKCACRT